MNDETTRKKGSLFPDILPSTEEISKSYILKAGDIKTKEDIDELIGLLYTEPESSFYYFSEKDKGNADTLLMEAENQGDILMNKSEFFYYEHPKSERYFMKIEVRDGNYQWPWQKEVVEKGPMFVKKELKLSQRKRTELETLQKIGMEKTFLISQTHSENITFTLMAVAAIGAILVGVFSKNPTLLIWTVFASIVLILLAIAIKWKTKLFWISFYAISILSLIMCIRWQISVSKQAAIKPSLKVPEQLTQQKVDQLHAPTTHKRSKTTPTIYSDSYMEEADQPKLSIRPENKPYLRYKVIGKNRIEFSYELSISNLGKNNAINISYSHIRQKLVVSDKVVINVDYLAGGDKPPSKSGYIAPAKIISGDRYFQIFQLNGNDLNANQINDLINNYGNEQLSIISDIGIEYTDAITHKKYKTGEILRLYKSKDQIVNDRI